MVRRPENEWFLGMLRENPWVEVSVNNCQLDRSRWCGTWNGGGSVTPFRELTELLLAQFDCGESRYPLDPLVMRWE